MAQPNQRAQYFYILMSAFFIFYLLSFIFLTPVHAAAPYSGTFPRLLPVPGITCESLNGTDKTECRKQICPTGSSCDRGKCIFPGGDYDSAQLPCNYTLDELVLVGVNFAKILYGIVGSLMLVMFVAGGFIMLTSGGNPEEIQKGRKMLTGALVGGIIVLGAALLTQFTAKLVGVTIPVDTEGMHLVELPASGGSAGSQSQGAGSAGAGGAGTGGGVESTGASGAGTGGGCTCNVSISVSALLPVNGQDICNRAIAQDALCEWAGSSCDCAGPLPGIQQDDCSLERLRQRYDPGVPGVTVNGSCSWR